MQRSLFTSYAVLLSAMIAFGQGKADSWILDKDGAIVRGDLAHKELAVVFLLDSMSPVAATVLEILKENRRMASFFISENVFHTERGKKFIKTALDQGLYLGISLKEGYIDERNVDTVVISFDKFKHEFHHTFHNLAAYGIRRTDAVYVLSKAGHYNKHISDWIRTIGSHLVSYPLALSPLEHIGSENLLSWLKRVESITTHGLNGSILPVYLNNQEVEKFETQFRQVLDYLEHRGYLLLEINELLE